MDNEKHSQFIIGAASRRVSPVKEGADKTIEKGTTGRAKPIIGSPEGLVATLVDESNEIKSYSDLIRTGG